MSRGMINLLLLICWMALVALLVLKIWPGWLAFVAAGILISIGYLNNAGRRSSSTLKPNGGEMFGGFRKRRSYDDIIESIQQKRREKGDAALSNPERRLLEGHIFEAYFFHQGGFDYYFSHVDDVQQWGCAAGALIAVGRDDVTPIFSEAIKLYTEFDHGAADQEATQAYLSQIKEIDARFRTAIPDLDARLRDYAKQI